MCYDCISEGNIRQGVHITPPNSGDLFSTIIWGYQIVENHSRIKELYVTVESKKHNKLGDSNAFF